MSVILLSSPVDASQLGCWESVVGNFRSVIGYTVWGDFFLQDPNSKQIAVLYVFNPELVPLTFDSIEKFVSDFLSAPEVQKHLIRPDRFKAVTSRLGTVEEGEVFIPVPFPFLGGTCAPDTYMKGNVWTFFDLAGQLQKVSATI